ncbi:GspE/PulE family protein [Acidithiobacillus ferridurans]|uniref:Type II secretion system protein E n=2 Tax=Acidithiobacillus ferridurans TaxID=1232575 RepID=A0A2Z6IIM9_ACIFI|nr:GspE/PulE family protein [Acidithiobacillus ferridurans]MBU2717422.1 type II/IV secretion system protein [Acidithiobacillus ferridurans]MBU2721951.1 type II/IV secretion system protein [Acidithiobacillus ferridurans]MBU2726686.1 type II/IV secretion system protein [Acidithiobacillus ferridurans]RBL98986.1 MSHA biogenesis protein MshE [Acidithiobacillus ferridurans]BBF65256.1 Type II secretion system protein E [Acidithiobacillus ferridurans]
MASRLQKIRLGDLLVQNGIITAAQLDMALTQQRGSGRKLGQELIAQHLVTEEDLLNFLARQLHLERIDLSRQALDPQLVSRLPESLARRYRAIPLRDQGERYVVGMADPTDLPALDAISRAMGKPVKLALISETELLRVLPQLYGAVSKSAELRDALGDTVNTSAPPPLLESSAEDAPVVRLLNAVFTDAARLQASDIHFEPEESGLRVRLRVDGVLREHLRLDSRLTPLIVSKLKVMTNLDIAERRLPQDGRMHLALEGKAYDVRMATMPVQDGESVVLRLLDQQTALLHFNELGMPGNVEVSLQNIMHRPHGLFLVTGPTGSGKSTTLYAALNEINTVERKIFTVEDPVEYRLQGISQVQVHPRIGLDFARVLRTILRQDPDVIMVGEIRDHETAEIAARAALTGHLVLATLHTNDAVGAFPRLQELEVEPFLIGSAVLGVMAQRLVRRICPSCKTEDKDVSPAERAVFAARLGVPPDFVTFFCGKGCNTCNFTGYRGRQPVFELIRMDPLLRAAILGNSRAALLDAANQQQQFTLLREEAMRLVWEGITTLAEMVRVTSDAEED